MDNNGTTRQSLSKDKRVGREDLISNQVLETKLVGCNKNVRRKRLVDATASDARLQVAVVVCCVSGVFLRNTIEWYSRRRRRSWKVTINASVGS
jgi:hypothetical protein